MLLKNLPYYPVTMRLDTPVCPTPRPLPAGYRFARYTPRLLQGWVDLQVGVEHIADAAEAAALFAREFLSQPALLQQRCLFVLDETDTVVAFAALWQGEGLGRPMARIHWVAVAQAHQGRGLAKALMDALLGMYHQLGLVGGIYLTSQTWSAKAARIYRKCGFLPCNGDGTLPLGEEAARAWAIIEEEWASYETLR